MCFACEFLRLSGVCPVKSACALLSFFFFYIKYRVPDDFTKLYPGVMYFMLCEATDREKMWSRIYTFFFILYSYRHNIFLPRPYPKTCTCACAVQAWLDRRARVIFDKTFLPRLAFELGDRLRATNEPRLRVAIERGAASDARVLLGVKRWREFAPPSNSERVSEARYGLGRALGIRLSLA